MNARLPQPGPSCAAISDDPLGLTRIFDPEIRIAQWRRPVDTVIGEWLDAHADNLGIGFRQTLAADLGLLGEMFGELLDAPTIGLRLEVVRKAMCPRLHVDRVGIRLLCTYRGPGSEWVEDAAVDRRFLGAASGGRPDESSGLLLPGHLIERIPPFAVALLKGSLWQDSGGLGIVHRSPAVPAGQGPRVLVALDASWD
jgi:hypothetical protein